MEELSLYDPTARGTADVWQKIAGPLHQRLCVEWDYCQIRKTARFENDIDLAVAVLTTLTTQALALPIAADIPLIAALVLKRGLDTFCSCP